jgi:hypothetical protein
LLKLLHKWFAYQSFLSLWIFKENSEAVEKGSLATPCDFMSIKNQQVTSNGKLKMDRIWGFSTASAVIFNLENEAFTYYCLSQGSSGHSQLPLEIFILQ